MDQNPQPPYQPQPQWGPQPPVQKQSWFARHKILTGVGAFVIVAGGISAAAGGSSNATAEQAEKPTNSTATTDSSSKGKTETAKAEEKEETSEGLQPDGKTWVYGDWRISNVNVSNSDGLNWFKVTSTVTYLGEDNSGGDKCFNLSLDKADLQVASGFGCANNMLPGKSAKLDFSTTDDFVKGPWEITINKSW